MGFWGELATGLAKIASEVIEEKLEYYGSYKNLVREVESENPNPEEILKSANTFLPLAEKLEKRTENEEVIKDNTRKVVKVLFFKGCALLELDRSKEGCKSWGKIIFNYRDDTDSEVSKYVIASYGMLDDYYGYPRCGSCHVKKTVYKDDSMTASVVKNTVGYGAGSVGAVLGTMLIPIPVLGTAAGGLIGHALGSIGGSTLAEEAMKKTVRECPDCGYEF